MADALREKALRLLGRREYARSELRRRLLQAAASAAADDGGFAQDGETDAAAVDALLDDLAARHLLSDERYAEGRVHSRERRYGDRRLAQELRQQGVAPDVIAGALEGTRESELTRARALWQRKYGSLPTSPQERQKQVRFLMARGFSAQTIRSVLAGDDDMTDELSDD